MVVKLRESLERGDVDTAFLLLLYEIFVPFSPGPRVPNRVPKWKWKELAPKAVRDPLYQKVRSEFVETWRPVDGLRFLLREGRVPALYSRRVRELVQQEV